jgi:hypothetical protein
MPKQMSLAQAKLLMPSCLVGALDNPQTTNDLRYAAQLEIDLFESQEDGCLSADEIRKVRWFLGRLEAYNAG